MDNGLHFISGLPRSGSTLLAALLRQDPSLHAGMSSPVGDLTARVVAGMGPGADFAPLISERQRRNVLLAMFEGYYRDVHGGRLVFDTHRTWCARLPFLAELFPAARIIVCVRDLAWIMDSFERILRRTPLGPSRLFKPQDASNVFTRVQSLASPGGTVGFAWSALQEAFYGEHAHRLLVIDYEALARDPRRALAFVYDELGLPPFAQDFRSVAYDDGEEVDRRLGVPGLHAVGSPVLFAERQTILPPELFARFSGRSFWRDPGDNPRGVKVLLPPTESAPEGSSGLAPIAAARVDLDAQGPPTG